MAEERQAQQQEKPALMLADQMGKTAKDLAQAQQASEQ